MFCGGGGAGVCSGGSLCGLSDFDCDFLSPSGHRRCQRRNSRSFHGRAMVKRVFSGVCAAGCSGCCGAGVYFCGDCFAYRGGSRGCVWRDAVDGVAKEVFISDAEGGDGGDDASDVYGFYYSGWGYGVWSGVSRYARGCVFDEFDSFGEYESGGVSRACDGYDFCGGLFYRFYRDYVYYCSGCGAYFCGVGGRSSVVGYFDCDEFADVFF